MRPEKQCLNCGTSILEGEDFCLKCTDGYDKKADFHSIKLYFLFLVSGTAILGTLLWYLQFIQIKTFVGHLVMVLVALILLTGLYVFVIEIIKFKKSFHRTEANQEDVNFVIQHSENSIPSGAKIHIAKHYTG